ncbi:nucleotide exchange factor GrpE [Daejeonella sp.]|jgi:molecular chaperone GrpE|uniref:nucleotide exchange factor GrpE n=1 Tax=Daejeonella sp. TaxID=2805397 RepID=UPI003783DE4B
MKFSELLNKKKKTKMEENQTTENTNQNEIVDENEALNTEVPGTEEQEGTAQEVELSEEEKLKAESAEWNNKYLRLYAEFDNFKRRTSKERLELMQMAGKDVIVDLLTVLDDFERAQKSIQTATDVEAVKEGVNLVHNKLKSLLSSKGLKEMNAIGTEFDADLHEGITNIPAPTADLKGKVIDELEKGYYLNDKVIRFAKVIIGA